MELYTRSYTGLSLQLAHYFGIPLPILPHSTLNEKFNISASASLGTNELPRVAYFAIGNGGHASKSGLNSFPLLENKIHKSRDTGMFNQLPFVLRPVGNDLDDNQRTEYALRRVEEHNGQTYIAYYLKRLDRSALQIKTHNRAIDANQQTVISNFEPVSDDLSPVPEDLVNSGVNSVKGKYIGSTVNLTIPFTAFDSDELLNAVMIIYGSEYYAIISETALVSGVDRTVSSNDGQAGTISFNECVCAQIVNHIPVLQPVFSQRQGFDITAEVGGIEPLLNLELIQP